MHGVSAATLGRRTTWAEAHPHKRTEEAKTSEIPDSVLAARGGFMRCSLPTALPSRRLDRHPHDPTGEGVVTRRVVVRDVRLAVHAHVRALVGGERVRLRLRDPALGDLLAIDAQDRPATRAGRGRIRDELVDDRVPAGP